ncbi:carbonic anhydrase [Dactylosporangium sp. NPDC006015]|uniref:carbonic anhydrase n=1 Tax=Dactylosporangium sp. NPDC006015 TaxID=3154576 RepID=UPI0033AA1810
MQTLIDHARAFPETVKRQSHRFARLADAARTDTMPMVRRWLGHTANLVTAAEDLAADPAADLAVDLAAAAQRHVLTQLDHLQSHPCVARRLATGRLRLHAWVYAVDTGQVLAARPGSDAFRPL